MLGDPIGPWVISIASAVVWAGLRTGLLSGLACAGEAGSLAGPTWPFLSDGAPVSVEDSVAG